MRIAIRVLMIAWLALASAFAQDANLNRVLSQMDSTSKAFRSAEATFVWDQYQKVIDESDTQKGKIYFRRQDKDVQMAAEFTGSDKKYVLYSGGKMQVYQPTIDQVTEYNVGKNKGDIESYLVLGFGGSGHELLTNYDVKYAGQEPVNGVQTEKLEMVPKSVRVKNNIARILLWIDPARGVSLQQQFFEPSGDYRLAKYSDIQLNQKLPDNVFKLKTTGKTKVVSP